MKKLLLATTMMATVLTSAHADIKPYLHSGVWSNYAGRTERDNPVCGMMILSPDRELHIKYIGGDSNALSIQVFKNSWRIPDGTRIKVEIGFDKSTWGSTDGAYGGETGQGKSWRAGMVMIEIGDESVSDFLENVAASNIMWVSFPDGNEQPWDAKMEGSRNSVNSLIRCMAQMKPDTQPHTSGTQPHSQPFRTKPVDDAKASRNQI